MFRFVRPKPKIELLGYDLLQKCYASGTPKGKAKLKTGQPLKRNKLTIKKGGGSGGGGGEEAGKGKGRISDEKQKLYDQCINAPCPVRYLRPKDIEREAKREKLGLISKARQREIEIQKKSGYKMGVITTTTEPMRIGTPGLDYISLGIFTEDELPKYKVTVEDGKRLAKEYSRVLMREHRAKRVAETNLLKLRKAAIEALPEHLKKAALVRDLTPFPANRGMATLTPPIEGYLEKIMNAAARKNSGKEKLR